MAAAIGSVSLFADSIDFLEDASLNTLVFLALAWPATWRARLGFALAGVLMVPSLATVLAAWEKISAPAAPNPVALSLTGAAALVVNLTCALVLAQHRHHGGSLTKAAFLSSRNDVLANIAIIVADLATALTLSAWPDIVVGLSIALKCRCRSTKYGPPQGRSSSRLGREASLKTVHHVVLFGLSFICETGIPSKSRAKRDNWETEHGDLRICSGQHD